MTTTRVAPNQLIELRGKPVYSSDGEKVGKVHEVFFDPVSNQAEWIGIGTGLLGMKRLLVPVNGARIEDRDGECVMVPFSKQRIKDAPDIRSEDITMDEERQLWNYYGMQAPQTFSGTTEGGSATISRHEEELRVGKREVERGRVRLHKWVEIEPVSTDVELRSETADIERETIDRPASQAEFGNEDIEVPLHEEEPVVEKRVMEKERVTVRPRQETRRETISEEVRRERVDTEGDVDEV